MRRGRRLRHGRRPVAERPLPLGRRRRDLDDDAGERARRERDGVGRAGRQLGRDVHESAWRRGDSGGEPRQRKALEAALHLSDDDADGGDAGVVGAEAEAARLLVPVDGARDLLRRAGLPVLHLLPDPEADQVVGGAGQGGVAEQVAPVEAIARAGGLHPLVDDLPRRAAGRLAVVGAAAPRHGLALAAYDVDGHAAVPSCCRCPAGWEAAGLRSRCRRALRRRRREQARRNERACAREHRQAQEVH